LVPVLGIIVCVLMMASLPIVSWERLAIWMALGILIYYAYSKKNSKIRNEYRHTLK
jgi:APA family basic amino acid/polyamine antiporter